MTREEAIEELKGQIKCLKCETGIDCEKCRPNWSSENDIEALDTAIKALEQEPTSVIEELEKIKAELLSECPNTNARMICMSILDKHISELKGE